MSPDEVSRVIIQVANMVLGQNWKRKNEKHDVEDDDERDDNIICNSDIEDQHNDSSHLDYVLPSRRSIMRYLNDAFYLNLEYIHFKCYKKKIIL